MSLALLVGLMVLIVLGIPIAFAMLGASLFGMLGFTDVPLGIASQWTIASIDSFPLMAIPFFTLAGSLLSKGGMAARLVDLAKTLVGHWSGGVSLVMVVTSMLFSALSGSGAATVAAVGVILIPALMRAGYSRHHAGAQQAVAGELGVILPPSIPMILFGVSTGVSIGSLFMAGVVPGLLIGVALMLFAYVYAKMKGIPGATKASWPERWTAIRRSVLAVFMPGLILGGIYGGVFTPTESAAFAVLYGFIVSLVFYRELKVKDLPRVFVDSALVSAMIMLILAAAGLLAWLLTLDQLPHKMTEMISGIVTDQITFLLVVNVFLLIVGTVFEPGVAILILAPILTPMALAYGVDPVHFGIIMVVNLAVGMVTPPVGANLFIAIGLAKSSLERISVALIPFFLLMLLDIALITYLPQLSLWLPSLMK